MHRFYDFKIFTLILSLLAVLCPAAERPAVIPFPTAKPRLVSGKIMQQIHDEVKTPHKYGVILKGAEGELLDCPNVFRHGGRWYMIFYANKDKVGYETHLAVSDDLLRWERIGPILPFTKQGWDAWQAGGGLALYDTRWDNATHELGQHDGKYWLSFLGGEKQGYEPDPLAIGLAFTEYPSAVHEWTRLPENPVLSPDQPDTRDFEHTTLYKSAIIRDEARTLGAPGGASAPVQLSTMSAPPRGPSAAIRN